MNCIPRKASDSRLEYAFVRVTEDLLTARSRESIFVYVEYTVRSLAQIPFPVTTSAKKVLALRVSDTKTDSRLKMHRRTLAMILAKQQNSVDKRSFLGIRSWETPVSRNPLKNGVFIRPTESQKRLTRRK